jgi:hypothetical protein
MYLRGARRKSVALDFQCRECSRIMYCAGLVTAELYSDEFMPMCMILGEGKKVPTATVH